MLEILIMIGVVKTFASIAESKGRSKFAWWFLGALSYYGPILLMSFVLLPIMAEAGMLTFVTQQNAFVLGLLINLGTGIACCLIAFLILKGLPNVNESPTKETANTQRQPIDLNDDNPYRSNM